MAVSVSADVAAGARLSRDRLDLGVAERLEQPPHELLAAARGHGGQRAPRAGSRSPPAPACAPSIAVLKTVTSATDSSDEAT